MEDNLGGPEWTAQGCKTVGRSDRKGGAALGLRYDTYFEDSEQSAQPSLE